MGAQLCGEDYFKQLSDKYGENFVQLVCSQKAKKKLQQKHVDAISRLRQQVREFQNKTNISIDEKIQVLNKKFQKQQRGLKNVSNGSMNSLQNIQKIDIYEQKGFRSILENIEANRKENLLKLSQKEKQSQKQLFQKSAIIYDQISSQKPKLPLYEQIPKGLRIKILQKAETQFHDKIEERNKRIEEKINYQFNPTFIKLHEFFQKQNPDNFMNGYIQRIVKSMSSSSYKDQFGDKLGGKLEKCIDCDFFKKLF